MLNGPTQKPVELIETLLGQNYGNRIFDPYMGSGTTLVAARRLGRCAIGVEVSERYCEAAVIRLQANE